MNYFVRISSQNRPANRLQQSILDHFQRYQQCITSDPNAIYNRLLGAVEQCNKSHRRCNRQSVYKQQDYQTKEINSIYVTGLVSLSVSAILREVDLYPTPPKPDPTTTTADEPAEHLPRAVIYKFRGSSEEYRLDYWHKFSTQVQELLRVGSVWRIYLNENATPIVELYGGRTIPAYL